MEIRLQDLNVGYGRTVVSEGLNASLSEGQLVCLLGTNGTGKSTLLRTIAGFQKALGGQVLVNEKPIQQIDVEHLPHLMSVCSRNPLMCKACRYANWWAWGALPIPVSSAD